MSAKNVILYSHNTTIILKLKSTTMTYYYSLSKARSLFSPLKALAAFVWTCKSNKLLIEFKTVQRVVKHINECCI